MPREPRITVGGVARALGVLTPQAMEEAYQQALVEQRTRALTAQLVESLPHAVWCFDLHGGVEIANAEARRVSPVLLDPQAMTIGGRAFVELVVAREPQAWDAVPYELRSHVATLEGTSRLTVTAVDVTRERAMLARLADAERRASVGVLGAGVAHEINNPLGFVNANVRSMRDYLSELGEIIGADPRATAILEDLPSLFDETERGLSRIAHIVKELLHFSVRGGAEEPTRIVYLPDIVDQAINLCGHELRKRGSLERHDAPGVPIAGTPRQLGDVVIDLLINAFDAVTNLPEEKRVVKVRTYAEGPFAILEIEDKGVGIPAHVLPHVFDPFFTTKGRARGTGLGLSVASEVVRRHGGELQLQSREGQGTVVKVLLPARTPGPT
jgi:signal transduction histidine kinase